MAYSFFLTNIIAHFYMNPHLLNKAFHAIGVTRTSVQERKYRPNKATPEKLMSLPRTKRTSKPCPFNPFPLPHQYPISLPPRHFPSPTSSLFFKSLEKSRPSTKYTYPLINLRFLETAKSLSAVVEAARRKRSDV
jgi:hypothetical protein